MTASARRRIRAPWLAFPLALLTLLAPAAAAPAFADEAPAPDAAVVETAPAPVEPPAPDPVVEPSPEPTAEPTEFRASSAQLFAAAAVAAPVLTVTPASVDPAVATTLTVSGTGYTGPGAANGVYVNVGSAADWQPGQVPGQAGWVVSGWVRPNQVVDGAFTTTLIIPAGALTGGGSYGVATFAAHGLSVTDRTLDAWKAITLVVPANPVLTVTPSSIDPAIANTLTISGTGYTGPGAANGVYVNVGTAADWQPGQVPGQAGWVASGWVRPNQVVDGAFTTTLTIPAGSLTGGGSYGVATFAAHALSATNRTLDAWKALTVTATGPGTDPGTNPGTDPGTPAPALTVNPGTVDPTVATSITVSGSGYRGAGAANGVYVSLGSSSNWRPGQVPSQGGWVTTVWVQPGALRNGAFTTTLSIPAGALVAGGSYGVATFAAHGLSLTNRTLDAWKAILLGAPGSGTSGTASTGTPADTPPTDEGIELETDTLEEGGTVTASASGFQAGESGILVVIYSDPVVLDTTATADADGTVHWTGRLPAGLTGDHTLTFQGSVDVGVPIAIAERELQACTVDDARLDWGFKESFRSYIDGSIANGEWTTAGDAGYETPAFFWTTGSGDLDIQALTGVVGFEGSVRFIGHAGVLDTTIANPRIELDGDTGILLLDIAGTTQDGRELTRVGVPFATLDLSALESAVADGVVTLRDLPAVLTPEGAEVFGTYEAGEALDPVTLTLPVGCDTGTQAEVSASGVEPTSSGMPAWLIWALVAALLAAIVVTAVVLLRRRRA